MTGPLFHRDLSDRARLRLSGPDRVRFLHGMVTNDIEALVAGAGCHAAMLTTKGKMVADLVVWADADALWLSSEGEARERVIAMLNRHMVADDCELEDQGDATGELGVYGESIEAVVAALGAALGGPVPALALYAHALVGGVRVARTGELGVAGFHLVGERPRLAGLAERLGAPLSSEAFEVMRIEAGTPRYGTDMGEDRLPIEAGLDDAVSFTKGCYLGQEVIARATHRGHINRKLMGLLLDGDCAATPGARLAAPERPEAGVVTSSVVSARLGRPVALGYVHRTLWTPGTRLELHEPDGSVRTAEVAALPLVRR